MQRSQRLMEATFVLVAAVILLTGSTVSGVQEFDEEPSDAETNPRQSVTLACRVRARKGECVWLKDRRAIGKVPNKYQFSREPADGDCSVTILNARLEEDDGLWQCQVTQASIDTGGLESREARLIIREAPQPPHLEEQDTQISAEERLSARAGETKTIRCVSRMGNPPAIIRWFLENEEITDSATQTNASDVAKPRTYVASSVLQYTFEKADNGRTLSCRAYHGAYADSSLDHLSSFGDVYGGAGDVDDSHHSSAPTAYKQISIPLNVMYRPTVRLEGNDREDVEEGANLVLRCAADANPPANIVWRKSGQAAIYDIKEQIVFRSVQRSDSGVYSCSAKNDVGESAEMQVVVDVRYKPRIVRIEPPPPLSFNMKEQIRLTCVAEGNPTPRISWLQRVGRDPKVWNMRSRESTLVVANASYAYQGVYVCEATNDIGGKQYRVQSQETKIDIKGPPQILADHSRTRDRVIAASDDDALLAVFFCSDPRPRDVLWSWGSQSLLAGKTLFRYVADPLIADEGREDCYEARLTVRGVQKADSRRFSLNVTNDRGSVEHVVQLDVREPVSTSLVIAVTAGGVAFLLIFLTIFVYLIRSEKMCFSRTYNTSGMFKGDPSAAAGGGGGSEAFSESSSSSSSSASREPSTPSRSLAVGSGSKVANRVGIIGSGKSAMHHHGNKSNPAAIPPDALYVTRQAAPATVGSNGVSNATSPLPQQQQQQQQQQHQQQPQPTVPPNGQPLHNQQLPVMQAPVNYDGSALKVPVLPKPDVTINASNGRPALPASQPPALLYASLDHHHQPPPQQQQQQQQQQPQPQQAANGRLRSDHPDYSQFQPQQPQSNVTTVSVQQF